MKVVSGVVTDGSRTAFLIAEDCERGIDRPTLLIVGSWCSLLVSSCWLVLVSTTALFVELEDIGLELLALTVVPLFGAVMAIRLIRDTDDVAALVSLVPLHLFGTIPMLAITLINPGSPAAFAMLSLATILTAAPPILFWLDARAWARS